MENLKDVLKHVFCFIGIVTVLFLIETYFISSLLNEVFYFTVLLNLLIGGVITSYINE